MTTDLEERLNQILPKITGEDFLERRGLGNEIAFFIFDYPAEDELRVRQHVKFLLEHIPKHKPKIKLTHIDLFFVSVPSRTSSNGSSETRRLPGDSGASPWASSSWRSSGMGAR